jgi:pyrimidine operon attenuation protein / uracil phosphoribosyltransferase
VQEPQNRRAMTNAKNWNASDIDQAISRLAEQINQNYPEEEVLCLIGLRSRGDCVAERLLVKLSELSDRTLHYGILDISLYRDDLAHKLLTPQLQSSEIDFEVEGARIILVDDVLFTGRTVIAALAAIADYGRAASVELAVLVDREHRELPVSAHYVGIKIATKREDHVHVSLEGTDSVDFIELVEK